MQTQYEPIYPKPPSSISLSTSFSAELKQYVGSFFYQIERMMHTCLNIYVYSARAYMREVDPKRMLVCVVFPFMGFDV